MSLHPAALAAIASLALVPAPAEAGPLEGLIGFADPQTCAPEAGFETLLGGLLTFEGGAAGRPGLGRPAVPEAYRAAIGEPTLSVDGREYRVSLPVRGDWRGLPLRAVQINGWLESERGLALLFDATPEQVLRAANAAGFALPDTGSVYREGEVMGMSIGVERHPDGAILYCMPG